MATANCTVTWSVDGSSQESTTFSKTEEGVLNAIDVNSLAIPQTNYALILNIDVSQVKFIVIMATADCTLKANSSGSPAYTLTLKANEPLLHWLNCPYTSLLTTDTTVFYLTAAGTGTMDLTIRGIYDPT